jgi:parallel beta-helix repeat protein
MRTHGRLRRFFGAAMAIWVVVSGAGCGGDDGQTPPATNGGGACVGRCIEVSPSANDYESIMRVLIDARPGDEILLRAGTYHLTGQLSLDVDNVTIRGEGMDKTILSFKDESVGAEAFFVTGNHFLIEDLALEDSPGDLLKILGVDGATIRRVRAEWTRGPSTANGSYGFYPVASTNVLIEESIVRGASDAGFYVGQCHGIIVRRNTSETNVAGIEIENSTDADVYDNTATHNTGGILVFNLPGVPFIDGRRTRVFHNQIIDNDTPNFAVAGATVSAVPTGTGMMILANDQVEVFDNDVRDNGTTGLLIISYNTAELVAGLRGNDPSYDKYSETLYIHDNRYSGGGTDPDPSTGDLIGGVTGFPLPDIVLDGYQNPRKLVGGQLPQDLRTCIQEPTARFWNVDLPHVGANATSDLSQYDCSFAHLPAVVIPGVGADTPPPPAPRPTSAQPTPTPGVSNTETRCRVPSGAGVNFDPADEPCEFLSSYRFFRGEGAKQDPNDGVVPYDLNTQLFADYAVKHRFVWLPPGTSAQYNEAESFDFPVGTVIIKTFAYPDDLREPSGSARLLETRLLVHRSVGWAGLPYVWNTDQTEARLAVVGTGLSVSATQQNGQPRTVEYNVPNANQCKECHREHNNVMGPLGPKARNLNKSYPYATGAENQLAYWTRLGLLQGAPDPSQAPRTAVFDDPTSGTLEERARGYLDVNCASCHNPSGAARTTGLYLSAHETDPLRLGVCKSPVAAGRGSGNLSYDIQPGTPDASIMVFRMSSVEPGIAMPELGRLRVHTEGVQVIRDWVSTLTGDCAAE